VGIDLWVLAIVIVAAMWIGYGIAFMGRKGEQEEQMETAGVEAEQSGFKVRLKHSGQTLAEQIQRLTDTQHTPESQSDYNASANWRPAPEVSGEADHKVGKLLDAAARRFSRDAHRKRGEAVHVGFSVGSPVQGEARSVQDDYQQGFQIYPRQGSVYAPASGKITRLYPTGNAFRLRTDEGVELTLRVGTNTEELEGMYFRPRVVQNEVVVKGKLLLEYDLDSIRQEGYDPTLWLTVEDHEDYQSIEFAKDGLIKIGESLLWISK
jgi:PTS system beta-glucosides-specific IIC component